MSVPSPLTSTVILVPVLNRPGNVRPLVESVEAATPEPHRVLFIVDDNDHDELGAIRDAGADYVEHHGPEWGTYARKINLGARCSAEPLLFSAADDLHFHLGWLSIAIALLSDAVQVVGTNDLGNPRTMDGHHSTHTLFTRAYIDDPGGVIDGPPGQVLHEGYPHQYCDDEFIGTARSRGVLAHALDSHVEHLHYLWGKGTDDPTYERGRADTQQARHIFAQRRHLWLTLS